MSGWVELRCPLSLKAKLHPEAGIIEIKCRRGKHHTDHEFDWFCSRTGRPLTEDEVRSRVMRIDTSTHTTV